MPAAGGEGKEGKMFDAICSLGASRAGLDGGKDFLFESAVTH
jgi:hypothetical protein